MCFACVPSFPISDPVWNNSNMEIVGVHGIAHQGQVNTRMHLLWLNLCWKEHKLKVSLIRTRQGPRNEYYL
jgi:hypothetical protein